MRIPLPPPDVRGILDRVETDKLERILSVPPLVKGRYEHWDKLRHREPPPGMTVEEWWLGIKLARGHLLKNIPLIDKKGAPFQFGTPDPILRLLHEIDKLAAGQIQMSEQVTNPATRNRYVVSSLIEEAVSSSQLEGASTTTDAAKDMLRSGRPPIDRSERMILNNFRAMEFIREHRDEPLTPGLVFTLHRALTEATLDDPSKAGRFRKDDDAIRVADGQGNVLHEPPNAAHLPRRLDALCEFANSHSDETFLHPVVRAVILHFWLAYDHPFVDGNGRTARAIFYWSMLSRGYWLAEYISISRILKAAPSQYSRSFLHTETDHNDLTYFIDYQLAVVHRAIESLIAHLQRKAEQIRNVETFLRSSATVNHRQLALLGHGLRNPGARYTIESHRRSHNVAYDTARNDLLDLANRSLLTQSKRGRKHYFEAPPDLADRLRASR